MISVIIPTHKQEHLQKVLEGLYNQTDKDFECIVVENPELTVSTQTIVANYLSKLDISLIKSNLGSNLARHIGIENSKYEVIALLDDDAVPCDTWITQIKALVTIYPNFGIFGGALINEYIDEKPKWIVNDFVAALSEIDWREEHAGPFEIIEGVNDPITYHPRYLVSANMFFYKERYYQALGLNTKIGYHGKDVLISNDEVEFVNRAKALGNPGMMYSQSLITRHQIDSSRMNLTWFRKRFYGQGYADGDMIRRYNSDKSASNKYHDHFHYLRHLTELCNIDNVMKAREKIADEESTREFIKDICICRTDYVTGYQNGLLESQLWAQNL